MLCTLAGAARIAHPAPDFATDVPACACLCENGAPSPGLSPKMGLEIMCPYRCPRELARVLATPSVPKPFNWCNSMDIRPICTKADHEEVLKEILKLMTADPELGTPDGDCLDVLVTLVQAFEAKHCPMPAADPIEAIEAIKFRMEQQGLTPRDLEPMIGRLNRVYEVLARRRPLTMAMARRLHAQLGISAESLIGEPDAAVR